MMSDETTLSELLALNLHKFEDEVHGIVDKATKELSMEKTLKELNVTWSQMKFQHEQHHRTETMLLKSDEELIETLEDNQVLMIWCMPYDVRACVIGSTTKYDDFKICWLLPGRGVWLAEEPYHC